MAFTQRLLTSVALLGGHCMATAAPPAEPLTHLRQTAQKYCVECHDNDTSKGDFNLEAILGMPLTEHASAWEKVVKRLHTRQMPPASQKERPSETDYSTAVTTLTRALDAAAAQHPQPGRTETIRRLTRTEYQNTIRDLLGIKIDAASLLPADELSHGFDNITVGSLSPALLDRYISAAQKISRLALGGASASPDGETIRIKPDITQEDHLEGLPFGTRGGAAIPYFFPQDGEYEIDLRLARDRNDNVEGLHGPQEMIVLLDKAEQHLFTIHPPPSGDNHNDVDKALQLRLKVKAGQHVLGIAFKKNPHALLEYKRQPYEARFNFHRHPRQGVALYQVTISGPYGPSSAGHTALRARLTPPSGVTTPAEEVSHLASALPPLLRLAWRRSVGESDLARFLDLYRTARATSSAASSLEETLSALLVSREFLFRVESEPAAAEPALWKISPWELATRLSFFLWSSIPDDALLMAAQQGDLAHPNGLAIQVRRMLADPRSTALVDTFAAQWLHLRNLDSITPDGRLFPDFDDNLRQAMRRETELLFHEVLSEDKPITQLLRSDHIWVNERLAKHYGLPHVYGAHFRRVPVEPHHQRGGLLRQGSILTVTSYATRTSPTIRGKWILENLIGTPPPPVPPDVPSLDEAVISETLPVRERLAAHRHQTACASCHEFIDPPGFALENYDATGRWRDLEAGAPVNATGGLPDGRTLNGVAELEAGLMARPDVFASALTEKLLTFALGRGITPKDGPAVRKIVDSASNTGYKLSDIIVALVQSPPFTMRQRL